jgi:putative methyltransferase (TIGR04325 family)
VDAVLRKTESLFENYSPLELSYSETASLLSVLMAAAGARGNDLRVLDFGGACGGHYILARRLVPENVSLRWCVVETPAMVHRARSLENGELRFHSSVEGALDDLGTVDLLHCSGALQYVEDPLRTLLELLDVGAKRILFVRLAVHAGSDTLITVQSSKLSWNGRGVLPPHLEDTEVKYPVTLLPREQVLAQVNQRYEVSFIIEDEERILLISNRPVVGLGFEARLAMR